MTRLSFAIVLVVAACAANTPDHVVSDAAEPKDAGFDADETTDDEEPVPSALLDIELGPRAVPFSAWAPDDEIVVIQGPQGGTHTEHRARASGVADRGELHLAIIWGEVWRDDLVLARAGWEFWSTDWEETAGGYEVELPVLIFDDRPDFGPAELRATLELTDGRAVDYAVPIELVDIP